MQNLPAILAIGGGLGLIMMGFGFFGFLCMCLGVVLAMPAKVGVA